MTLSIITPAQRAAETHGVKALIMGLPGVGKTSLARHLDPAATLFVDIEAGTLSIANNNIDMVRPKSWPECRDLAVRIGGIDPAAAPNAPYSAQHLEQAGWRRSIYNGLLSLPHRRRMG
jgi:hypothetical protein